MADTEPMASTSEQTAEPGKVGAQPPGDDGDLDDLLELDASLELDSLEVLESKIAF